MKPYKVANYADMKSHGAEYLLGGQIIKKKIGIGEPILHLAIIIQK